MPERLVLNKCSKAKSSRKPEIPALTGIRAFVAWWVVGYHVHCTLMLLFPDAADVIRTCFETGYLGVDFFFMLSGFVIAYNYQDTLRPFDCTKFRKFLWARLIRLYPLHLATLLGCLVLYGAATWAKVHLNTGASNWKAQDFVANLLLVHAWTIDYHMSWNFPSWAISCEWAAYLGFPVFAMLFTTDLSRAAYVAILAILLGGYIAISLCGLKFADFVFSRVVFEFPAGVCLYQIYMRRDSRRRRIGRIWQIVIVCMLVATMYLCAIRGFAGELMIPILAVLLYSLATDKDGYFSRVVSNGIPYFWGKVSYALYMTHAVTSMVLVRALPLGSFVDCSLAVRCMVSVAHIVLIAVAATLAYFYVEMPTALYLRKMFRKS